MVDKGMFDDNCERGRRVGIVVPANNKGGPQKLAAMAAMDLAEKGYQVTIYVPILPYFYYMVTLKKRFFSWVRFILPYVWNWISNREFSYQEIMEKDGSFKSMKVRFIGRVVSRKNLSETDILIYNSIAQVAEYQHRFPQEQQIYLLNHPEENGHGYRDTFKRLRKDFRGTIAVISPFTAREISDHVSDPPVVLIPASRVLWQGSKSLNADRERRDVLLCLKGADGEDQGIDVVQKLLEIRPETSISLWGRDMSQLETGVRLFPAAALFHNIGEHELCEVYLDHSVFIFPSKYEGFGMPPVEALVCGCVPVLRPSVGVAAVYAKDEINSIHWDSESEKLAYRLSELLDNSGKLRDMRLATQESIEAFNPHGYGLRLLAAENYR